MKCLVNNLSQKDNYLHRRAAQCAHTIVQFVKKPTTAPQARSLPPRACPSTCAPPSLWFYRTDLAVVDSEGGAGSDGSREHSCDVDYKSILRARRGRMREVGDTFSWAEGERVRYCRRVRACKRFCLLGWLSVLK